MRMSRVALTLAALIGAAGGSIAQQFTDPFNYGAGSSIPGYTEERGDWTVSGTTLVQDSARTFQELTNDRITDADCCVEIVATHTATTLCYSGVIARHSGSGGTAGFFQLKAQDSFPPYDGFDSLFLYFHDIHGYETLVPFTATSLTAFKQARIRLQVAERATDVLVEMYVDTDMDGRWDFARSAPTTFGLGATGKVGVAGYGDGVVDDLKYFNGALWFVTQPVIGTAIQIDGRLGRGQNYVAACSFGNGGIPLGGGRSIPLTLDSLMFASLNVPQVFQGFGGTTSPTNGAFSITINAPNAPALKGVRVFASAVSLSGSSVAEIAPDLHITLQ